MPAHAMVNDLWYLLFFSSSLLMSLESQEEASGTDRPRGPGAWS